MPDIGKHLVDYIPFDELQRERGKQAIYRPFKKRYELQMNLKIRRTLRPIQECVSGAESHRIRNECLKDGYAVEQVRTAIKRGNYPNVELPDADIVQAAYCGYIRLEDG